MAKLAALRLIPIMIGGHRRQDIDGVQQSHQEPGEVKNCGRDINFLLSYGVVPSMEVSPTSDSGIRGPISGTPIWVPLVRGKAQI